MEDFDSIISALEADCSTASMFGVLIYTDRHPNVKKVLRDDDYWKAFDEITGNSFAVLSVKPTQGVRSSPSLPSGMVGYMVQIWNEPKENNKLIEAFELDSTEELPMLLLFTSAEGEILKIEIKLDENGVDKAYESIRSSLQFCATVISGIKKENLKNPEGLFASFSLQNDQRVRLKKLKNVLNLYAYIKSLLP